MKTTDQIKDSERNVHHKASGGSQGVQNANEVDLGKSAAVLCEHLPVLILCLLLSIAGAFAYLKVAPKTYEASSKLEIYVRLPRIMSDHNTASERIDTGKSTEAFNTQLEKIQSAELRDVVADVLTSTNTPDIPDLSRDEWARYLQDRISFAIVPGTFLISISAETESPELAALLANTYATAAAEHTRRITHRHSVEAVRWLEGQVDSSKKKLKDAEAREIALKMEANIESTEKQKLTSDNAIENISKELVEQESKKSRLQEMYNRIEAASADISKSGVMPSDVPRADIIQKRFQDYLDAQQDIQRLSVKYTDKHPAVQSARHTLGATEKELTSEMERARNTVAEDLRLTSAYVERMRSNKLTQIARSEKLQAGIDTYQARILPLKREIESLNNSFQGLLKRITEAQLAADETASQVEIVEHARPPGRHASPNAFIIWLLAAIAGPLAGIFLAMTMHILQNRIVTLADVEIDIGARVLGVIPLVSGKHGPADMARIIADDPTSIAAEAWAGVRSALISQHSGDEKGAWCLAVVSTFPGEGKTTGACNLAIAMAQVHKRVLLIDGDFRRPSVHLVFPDASPKKPLLSTLAANTDSNSFENVVAASGIKGLDVTSALSSGEAMPSGPLESSTFGSFMKWTSRYDVVVIDTPPMGPVHDAVVYSRYADDVVVLSHCKRSRKSALTRTIQQLERNGSPATGIVLNGYKGNHLSHISGRYGYYGYKKYASSS